MIPGQRDPDSTQLLRAVRDDHAALKGTVVSRWGRVPILGADPAAPPDGSLWIRSDTGLLNYRAAGVTRSADGRRTGGEWSNGSVVALPNGSAQDISWTTEVSDTDNFLTPPSASGGIPSGLAGLYLFSARVILSSSSVGTGALIRVLDVDSSPWSAPINQSDGNATLSFIIPVIATSNFRINIFQNSGVSINMTSARLIVRRLGPF